ncbi:MAG: pyrroline-5-carboxylate reductase family protein [Oscillospiraceae bacterium]
MRSPRRKRPAATASPWRAPRGSARGRRAALLGCTAETPQRILSDSRFVFLGVKPQMVVGVVESLKADILASEGIFVSMLAGVSLEKLALLLGADKKIIRIMPNTPCAVGQGLILYAANGRVSEDELCAFRELMAPAGALDELNEHLIDAASAVSGCGPPTPICLSRHWRTAA